MSLIDSMMTPCTMVDKTTVEDDVGSFKQVWKDGAKFNAAIVKNNTLDAKVAEKSGVTEVYTVTVAKGTPLEFHDIFRRESDGQIFRVTSNIKDSEAPAVSTIKTGSVSAERWELT